MNLSFENKVALVTGAGSGMGRATARAFAEAGATVALADVRVDAVRAAAEELVATGHKAIADRCVVADEAQVAAMVERNVSTFGRLDAAFNNTDIQSPAVETADASGEEFDCVHAINLRGVWKCMKYELRRMREQGSGTIVNNSSIGGLIGISLKRENDQIKGRGGFIPRPFKAACQDNCNYGFLRNVLAFAISGRSVSRSAVNACNFL
jgi:NAD(P)-dependent dehydrogenase (short-subunit alcohol dehydrogenase family)